MLKKIRAFFSFNSRVKLLLVEAYFYLGWARIQKVLPFSRVAPSLGMEMMETSFLAEDVNKQELYEVSYAIDTVSRYTFWESECLVKAIAGMKMLEKRNIESTLYLGTAKDETNKLIAHAWLRCGPYFITGSEGHEHFTIVSQFAKVMPKIGGGTVECDKST